MTAIIQTATTEYELNNIMAIHFSGGKLTIIRKDLDGDKEVITTSYTEESLSDYGQIIIR